MKIEIGNKYLITTHDWFVAPDGEQYKAVHGTVTAIQTDSEALGIKTNRGSTNWYVVIGNMLVAGCQVCYCIKARHFSPRPPLKSNQENPNTPTQRETTSRIFNADEVW